MREVPTTYGIDSFIRRVFHSSISSSSIYLSIFFNDKVTL